jgi:hypothetical protein
MFLSLWFSEDEWVIRGKASTSQNGQEADISLNLCYGGKVAICLMTTEIHHKPLQFGSDIEVKCLSGCLGQVGMELSF